MRLTKEQHNEIIELYTNKVMTQAQLAKHYSVSAPAICKIVKKSSKVVVNKHNYLTFAFIGSRSLIKDEYSDQAEHFFNVVTKCAKLGINFRSGGADGADYIAEAAYSAAKSTAKIEVFVPNKNFNEHLRRFSPECYIVPDETTFSFRRDVISQIHPSPKKLTPYGMRLHCRNVNQVSGDNLEHNVDAIVCWTPEGKTVGGTATAINIAEMLGIPVFNLGNTTVDVESTLLEFISKTKPSSKEEE
jgi:predicted DNA-binding protein YlxM (UPF0122 family)